MNLRDSRLTGVSGDLALVNIVDLLFVEEHLGVAQVHLPAHEDVEQVRVDMAVQPEFAEDLQRLGQGFALLIGPVLRGEGLEDVGDAHDACLD